MLQRHHFKPNCLKLYGQVSRAISTGSVKTILSVHTQPINVVVFDGPSGESSSQGDLILGGASRLDAFSGYPVRTWLPASATVVTTGTPEVRPSRSSRTKDSSPSNLQRLRQIGTKPSHGVLNPARVPL